MSKFANFIEIPLYNKKDESCYFVLRYRLINNETGIYMNCLTMDELKIALNQKGENTDEQ